ncbi:MAG: hypothetical protein DI536_12245 [Archangium gephyra]|uniref:Uncharacterized protein n=1 Tax=Archangium gephyra TaxID=48 RepID=A0A2W5TJR0_9BACT|nr:MAG: hypothetical protein DI536_12245 [Archangium gephyra]
MEVVLRPINDLFLQEVVFPAFELGVVDAAPALEHLLHHLNDEDTRVLLELVLDNNGHQSFFGLSDERWNQALYRLLFHEWFRDSEGWLVTQAYPGFAGPWEETFHLALMLDDPGYPYADEEKADQHRRNFWGQPQKQHGLATLLCGVWDPIPRFPPDQVLTVDGHGVYSPQQGIARADWSWRPMMTVNRWAAKLPSALSRLLEREVKRLAPVSAPEKHEILDYWLGRVEQPPILAVSFSGLGPRASDWIRDIGHLARLIRQAAAQQQGVTAVLGMAGRGRDHGRG